MREQVQTESIPFVLTESLSIKIIHMFFIMKAHVHDAMQTLSILLQNIRNQQTLFCLFSNDHINNIISLDFDFTEDDELLGYYVNLLKTISLRLDANTVQFFYHETRQVPSSEEVQKEKERESTEDRSRSFVGDLLETKQKDRVRPEAFALYSEAIRFAAHRDPMVRTAVRTLTLNVYSIPLPSLQRFLCSPPMSSYFTRLAKLAVEQCSALEERLGAWEDSSPPSEMFFSIKDSLSALEDILAYCNDILATSSSPPLTSLLFTELWRRLLWPVMLSPLSSLSQHANDDGRDSAVFMVNRKSTRDNLMASCPDKTEKCNDQETSLHPVGPLCSLYAIERALQSFHDVKVADLLVSVLFDGPLEEAIDSLGDVLEGHCTGSYGVIIDSRRSRGHSNAQNGTKPNQTNATSKASGSSKEENDAAAGRRLALVDVYRDLEELSPKTVRGNILRALQGDDAQIAAAILRIIYSITAQKHWSEDLLLEIGLLPEREALRRRLLHALIGDDDDDNGDSNETENAPMMERSTIQGVSEKEHCTDGSEQKSVRAILNSRERASSAGTPQDVSTINQLESYRTKFDEIVGAVSESLRIDLLCPLAVATAGSILDDLLKRDGRIPSISEPIKADDSMLSSRDERISGNGTFDARKGCTKAYFWRDSMHAIVGSRRSAIAVGFEGPWVESFREIADFLWERMVHLLRVRRFGTIDTAAATWIQGYLIQDLHWNLGGGNDEPAAPEVSQANSILAAQLAVSRVHSLVASLIVCKLLDGVELSDRAPPDSQDEGPYSPTRVRPSREIKEGMLVPVPRDYWKCRVSFSRGGEIKVLLCISGWVVSSEVAQEGHESECHETTSMVDRPKGLCKEEREEDGGEQDVQEDQTGSQKDIGDLSLEDVLTTSYLKSQLPAALVLDLPNESMSVGKREDGKDVVVPAAKVLSIAPLLGTFAEVDGSNQKWMHVEVRPKGSTLLKVLRSSQVGAELAAIQQGLGNGHWVLAFDSETEAIAAARKLQDLSMRVKLASSGILDPYMYD